MRTFAIVALLPALACAQQMVSMQTSGDTAIITVRVRATSFTTFSGAPYSAKRITNGVQVRPDGTRTPQNQTTLFYRDAAGRNRTEQQVALRDSPYMVTIMDPLLGCEYVLDPGNRIAHRLTGVQVATRPVPQTQSDAIRNYANFRPVAASPEGIAVHMEDLGTRTLQGLTVYGSKTTTTYPPGTREGNDRAIVTEAESWIAPSLGQVVVSSKNTSPDATESTYSLADVVLKEPDPSLFAPPSGYRIVDETSDFKISVPRNPASSVTKLSTHGPTAPTVANAPFAGTRTNKGIQVLADGTRVDRPERTVFSTWRDSLGRVRTEWSPQGNAPGGVEIKDPTAGYIWNLDFLEHVAYRTPLVVSPAEPGKPATSTVSLGVQVISGVPADGVRTVTASSTGKSTQSEIWTARDQGIVLLEKTTTANGDEATIALKNFTTKEPDPSLFRIPATYRILDEYGNELQASPK